MDGSDERRRVHQAFAGVQTGEEANVSVFVRLQRHDRLLQLLAAAAAGLLEVSWGEGGVGEWGATINRFPNSRFNSIQLVTINH